MVTTVIFILCYSEHLEEANNDQGLKCNKMFQIVLELSIIYSMSQEKTLEGPLDFKEIKLVHPKGNQS